MIRKRKRTFAAQSTYEATVEAVVCDLVHRQLEVRGGEVRGGYGQMGLLLLHGIEGATPPPGGLYDLSGYDIPVSCHPGIKKVIQAAINASKLPTRMPQRARKTIPKTIAVKVVLAAIGKRHRICHHLRPTGVV